MYEHGFIKRTKSVVSLPHSVLDCNCFHSVEYSTLKYIYLFWVIRRLRKKTLHKRY